jgi:hypothetical protein
MILTFKIIYTTLKIHLDVTSSTSVRNVKNILNNTYKDQLNNTQFDIIKADYGEEGPSLNINDVINSDHVYYIRYNIHGECNICCNTHRLIRAECNHEVCTECFNNLEQCPYCRFTYV